MKDWQFDVLFFVGVGSAVLLLFAPAIHLDSISNPISVTGVGTILTYVLAQRRASRSRDDDKKDGGSEDPKS